MRSPDPARRCLEPELMDQPELERSRHVAALRALRTVHLLSGTTARVWREVLRAGLAPDRPLRVLDLACGGGDVVVGLARRAKRAGLPLEVHGCDRSPVALEYARGAARRYNVQARFFPLDVVAGPLPRGYDLLSSSLFLHHLPDAEAVSLLSAMAEAAPAVFVQDLLRTRMGWAFAVLVLHTLARSEVARVDGPRSVCNAFSFAEVAALTRAAGLQGARLRRCWPERWALSWTRA